MSESSITIEWSKPTKVWTKAGPIWNRNWIIPNHLLSGFFLFWGKNKDRLKLQGYSITKRIDGKWLLNEWQVKRDNLKENFGRENVIESIIIPTVSTLPEYEVKNTVGLREWQPRVVSKLCASILKYGAAIDGSETGCGKTYSACAVARELGLKVAVVCPKSVMYIWKKVVTKHFNMDYEFVLNYESVKTGNFIGIGEWKPINRNSTTKYFHWNISKDTLIIFDESHRMKGHDTLNAKLGIDAKKQKYKILCLSATNSISPIECKTTGYILGLYKSNFNKFLKENDCEKGRFGWEFRGNQDVLRRLHFNMFIDRGVRLKKDDIPNFPETEIIAEAYNIDETSELELKKVYEEMNRELDMLSLTVKLTKPYKINALTIQLRALQRAELLKCPLIIEMVEDAIEDGMSIAVFMNFTETIKALASRLKTNCIVWGTNKGDERDRNIEDFQSDKERIILINAQAGGTGTSLQDLNGKYPRLALISPPRSAVILKQVLGRVHRDGALTKSIQKILFVAGTEEVEVCEKLRMKLDNLDLINDGDLSKTPIFIDGDTS